MAEPSPQSEHAAADTNARTRMSGQFRTRHTEARLAVGGDDRADMPAREHTELGIDPEYWYNDGIVCE